MQIFLSGRRCVLEYTTYVDVSVQFRLEDRINVHAKIGTEWALNMCINDGGWWTLHTWDNKPTQVAIDSVVDLSLRTIEVWGRRPRTTNRIEVIK